MTYNKIASTFSTNYLVPFFVSRKKLRKLCGFSERGVALFNLFHRVKALRESHASMKQTEYYYIPCAK